MRDLVTWCNFPRDKELRVVGFTFKPRFWPGSMILSYHHCDMLLLGRFDLGGSWFYDLKILWVQIWIKYLEKSKRYILFAPSCLLLFNTLCTFIPMNVCAVPFSHFTLSNLDYVKNSRVTVMFQLWWTSSLDLSLNPHAYVLCNVQKKTGLWLQTQVNRALVMNSTHQLLGSMILKLPNLFLKGRGNIDIH